MEVEGCKDAGAECDTVTEGFYTLCLVCVGVGALLFLWIWRTVRTLQEIDVAKWRVVHKVDKNKKGEDEEIKVLVA